ncbi:MAG: ABC transporter related protein [Parcubacteria group bacterium GW2011_GWA2_40_8]|uniref:ABC transporter domain-containing protein n=1 Tax=Candidatus Terrybacteria bacterium RIFCSPLOWO2_01_FULL_40_23 TaxID=1802366 RepID=A0A1G2PUA0_9BACT|nr:MAG: ABC transporter related protein [Parcubacteria group bacterium GW2011_GWB1_40_14]KKR79206.1 MAG: ABC transporter related protein [Parcubacteria group bacterium GW2011_GWA2_40_8]OHA51926.1 MAG: hypothetical protein A3A97_01880 [Candidatus Terrybacteria bacterium RIFCSPLOWO2_01_FULL_40_23]
MIEIKNVTKKFGPLTAVNQLSLSIPQGTIFGFIGPNGAGKTTTIKMLVGLMKPSQGEIFIDDKDVRLNPEYTKKQLGYVPDDPFVYEKMTGWEYLSFVGEIFGINKKERDERIEKLSKIYPLKKILDGYMDSYSRGNKQKLVILAAFLHTPKALLVDEPVVGLDPESISITKKLFRNFAKEDGGTIFISTHTLSFAQDICDRIGIIKDGKLLIEGTIDELLKMAGLSAETLVEAEEKNKTLEELYLHFVA